MENFWGIPQTENINSIRKSEHTQTQRKSIEMFIVYLIVAPLNAFTLYKQGHTEHIIATAVSSAHWSVMVIVFRC